LKQPETIEAFLACPYCGETISMLVDPSVERQRYVEDCEMCCRPIEISVVCRDFALVSVDADRID
jgi:hypothetical protein